MRKAGFFAVVAAGTLLSACRDDITVPNYNNPTTGGVASDPSSLQLLANGVAYQLGAQPGYIDDLGTLGRESYEYTPTEGRNFTNYVQTPTLDRAGFAAGFWAGRYTNLRNAFNLRQAADAAPIATNQKAATNGFAKTVEALELYYVIASRDTIGAPVEVRAEQDFIAPFVSRDSVYRYVSARLDEAAADLRAAGSASFPFTVNMEFRGVGAATPANFLRLNRAIAARVFAYRGSIEPRDARLSCGSGAQSCYNRALAALGESFLNAGASTRAALDAGVYNVYSTANGAVQNTLSRATTAGSLRYAHPSILRDTAAGPAARDANGRSQYTITNPERAADLRVQAKIITLATPAVPPSALAASAIGTPFGFSIYATPNSPIPIIRNEELILLRAEAYIGLGNLAAATADINTIRTVSGGRPPIPTLGTTAAAITELLYQRWLSLLYEGHRIIDHRRFNRLNEIPVDKVATAANPVQHFVNSVLPVPQAECLSRVNTPELLPAACR